MHEGFVAVYCWRLLAVADGIAEVGCEHQHTTALQQHPLLLHLSSGTTLVLHNFKLQGPPQTLCDTLRCCVNINLNYFPHFKQPARLPVSAHPAATGNAPCLLLPAGCKPFQAVQASSHKRLVPTLAAVHLKSCQHAVPVRVCAIWSAHVPHAVGAPAVVLPQPLCDAGIMEGVTAGQGHLNLARTHLTLAHRAHMPANSSSSGSRWQQAVGVR